MKNKKTIIKVNEPDDVKGMVPFALCGSWNESDVYADNSVIIYIGYLKENEYEDRLSDVCTSKLSTFVKNNEVYELNSRVELLTRVGQVIEIEHLNRFFHTCRRLFGEMYLENGNPIDPSKNKSSQVKTQKYSSQLAYGLSDTLCILSKFGDSICGDRLNFDLKGKVDQVIRDVIADSSLDRWLQNRYYLTKFAEASPEVFLESFESELMIENSELNKFFTGAVESNISNECLRLEFILALKTLAWNPKYFSSVARILFKIQEFEKEDSWGKLSSQCANAIFSIESPSTLVSVKERFEVLRSHVDTFKEAVMNVCISLLTKKVETLDSYTARPKWDNLENLISEPSSKELEYANTEINRLFSELMPFSKSDLEKILKVISLFETEMLRKINSEVKKLSKSATDYEKSSLLCALREGILADKELRLFYDNEQDKDRLNGIIATRDLEADRHSVYWKIIGELKEFLSGSQPSVNHVWLFEERYIDPMLFSNEYPVNNPSYDDIVALADKKRQDAIQEIVNKQGISELIDFVKNVNRSELVAQPILTQCDSAKSLLAWIVEILKFQRDESISKLLKELLEICDRSQLVESIELLTRDDLIKNSIDLNYFVSLLPLDALIWKLVARFGDEVEASYWKSVDISKDFEQFAASAEYVVEKLKAVDRPISGFKLVSQFDRDFEPNFWFDLYSRIKDSENSEESVRKGIILESILKILDNHSDVSDEEIAKLELSSFPDFTNTGMRSEKRIIAWQRVMSSDPDYLVTLLKWLYKESELLDISQHQEINSENLSHEGKFAYDTLKDWVLIPGADTTGKVNSRKFNIWMDSSYELAKNSDLSDKLEKHLGMLFLNYSRQADSEEWLPEVVLEFLNQEDKDRLRYEFYKAEYFSRGTSLKGIFDGGKQDRQLSDEFFALTSKYMTKFLHFSKVLEKIAQLYLRKSENEGKRIELDELWSSA